MVVFSSPFLPFMLLTLHMPPVNLIERIEMIGGDVIESVGCY